VLLVCQGTVDCRPRGALPARVRAYSAAVVANPTRRTGLFLDDRTKGPRFHDSSCPLAIVDEARTTRRPRLVRRSRDLRGRLLLDGNRVARSALAGIVLAVILRRCSRRPSRLRTPRSLFECHQRRRYRCGSGSYAPLHPMRPAMFWHQGDTRSDPWPDSDPTGHNGPHNISARIRAPASAIRRNRLMETGAGTAAQATSDRHQSPNTFSTSPTFFWTLPPIFSAVPSS
jgi:hypothetical protein